MTDFSRYTARQRVVQYRERARFAIERAAGNPLIRDSYLDLASSWNSLAEAVELELEHQSAAVAAR
jgi:hypothetical protein